MNYFSGMYDRLCYPRASEGSKGLRNAQMGAIHAIAAHSTLKKKEASIIVMPTGSGKTAVLMMAPYVLSKQKVLIVTPSVMVRGQIYDDYKCLQTLKGIGVFGDEVEPPSVFELKNMYSIAAIHEPHKSLASTLQFIGRFARTNASHIGSAKFIAMNDETLDMEHYRMFSSDAVWQDMIIDMSERKIYKDERNGRSLKEFTKPDNLPDTAVSLLNIRPNCHAKVFKVNDFFIENNFPASCGVEDEIYRDHTSDTIVAIAKSKSNPIWLEFGHFSDVENILFIIHYQKSTSLLFIYSQTKSEAFYDEIAKAFANNAVKIPRSEMNRVLAKMENYEFFNTGMQSRYSETGESYRIISGSNTAASIDETTGKMRSAGHAFCKAEKDGLPVTIGYSSGSKIWSSMYLGLPEYIAWCDEYGSKIADSKIVLKTNTNFDFLPHPRKLISYPENVIFCFLSDKTYSSPPAVYLKGDESSKILTEVTFKVGTVTNNHINVCATIDDVKEILTCDTEGNYHAETSSIDVKDGKLRQTLAAYLTYHPLQFKTTNDTLIEGGEIFVGDPESIIYSDKHIVPIDWDSYGTNIRQEFGGNLELGVPIQSALDIILQQDKSISYILFDHGTQEIADFIAITEGETSVNVALFHAKAMKGIQYNSDVKDIYDVLQQAIKSTIWLKSKPAILEKIMERRKRGNCVLKRGTLESLKKTMRSSKLLTATMFVVQPSISKGIQMPDKYKEVLAAANFYISNSGRVKELKIWGSK